MTTTKPNPLYLTALLCLGLFQWSPAGPRWTYAEGKSTLELAPIMQFWGSYTPSPDQVPAVKPRADLYLRRLQLIARGTAMPGWNYQTIWAWNNAGKDPFGGPTQGSGQDLALSRTFLQESWISFTADSNLLVITAGLLRPQTSREFNGSFSGASSLDFTLPYNYVRQHLVTRPLGRETGMDFMGQWMGEGFGASWNVGGYNATQELGKMGVNLRGHAIWSPLYTGRLSLIVGDPENPKASMRKSVQHFGKRTGITLSGWASHQGTTSQLFDTTARGTFSYAGGFTSNQGLGTDILLNYGGLAINAEAAWLDRKAAPHPDSTDLSYQDKVWHMRISYAHALGQSGWTVEPNATYGAFTGDKKSLQNPGGEETQIDIGVNAYPATKGIRFALHGVIPDGKPRSGYVGSTGAQGQSNPKNTVIVGEVLFAL